MMNIAPECGGQHFSHHQFIYGLELRRIDEIIYANHELTNLRQLSFATFVV